MSDRIDELAARWRERPFALAQNDHEAINARYGGLTKQRCKLCDGYTGRCEEDSIYLDEDRESGPVCKECRDLHRAAEKEQSDDE